MRDVCTGHIDSVRHFVAGVTLLLCSLFPRAVDAQQSDASPWLGTRFLIALPDTVTNRNAGTRITLVPQVDLFLFSFSTANVTVAGPAGSRSVTVTPGASATVSLYDLFPPGVTPFVDVPGVPVRKSVSVVSDRPIFLYCRFVTPFGSELFTPLPVDRWGTAYRLASLRNDFPFNVGITPGNEEGLDVGHAPPQALVIAAENDTRVTVTTGTGLNGPGDFALQAGEALLVEAERPLNNQDTAARDLTGSLISADKPVAVLSGNTRTAGGRGAYGITAPTTYNSVRNTLLEWLHPVDRPGTTFIYAPMMTEFPETEEIVRVVATEPGVTTLTTSLGGPAIAIAEGEFADLRTSVLRLNDVPTPFVLRTDKPAQAFAVSGSRGELIVDPAGVDYGGMSAWGPSMTLLTPVDEWITAGRFRFFAAPAGVSQHLVVVAEKDATVTLDGEVLELEGVPNEAYRWGRFKVETPGDHLLFSTGGYASGIVYGINRGYEAYRPLRAEKEDDPVPLHIAEYEEILSVSWSTPLPGVRVETDPDPDSLVIVRRDECDSTVLDVQRVVGSRDILTFGPMTAVLEPGSINLDVEIEPLAPLGPVTGYRIRLRPIDPTRDASGSVAIRAVGTERRVDFTYATTMVTFPAEIDFGTGLTVGTEYRRTIDLTNRKPFTGTVRGVALATGGNGFSIDAAGRFPSMLGSGESVPIDVVFNGATAGATWRDTLLIHTDCGTYAVPLEAVTAGEPPPVPLPTITGYDWGLRPPASTNDTLSFAGNAGTRGYRIREIDIADDAGGVFSLVAPFHNRDSVQPATRRGVGIRFVPDRTGPFRGSIRLVTFDGDTVTADLLGRGVDTANGGPPRLEIDDLDLDTICFGDVIDTFLVVRNPGNGPIRVVAATTLRRTNGDVVWPVPPGLPRDVPPGDSIRLPFRLTADALGSFEILIGVDSAAGLEGVVVRITGIAVECDPPALTVNDHDFGEVWVTLAKEGSVTIRNVGRGDVEITSAAILNDAESSFAYIDPAPPFIVRQGDSVVVRASFAPSSTGRKNGSILFGSRIGDLVANLTGVGKVLRIPAYIRRDYHAPPGEEIEIAIELEMPADSVYPARLDLDVSFADDLLDPLGIRDTAGAETPSIGTGTMSIGLNRTTDRPLTEGPLVRLRFLTRLSLLQETELPFTLECDLPYVEFDERPGLFTKDPMCGLEYRLFEFTRFGIDLVGPVPNPASDRTEFELEIPFDGQTTVLLYDLLGAERLRVLDQFLLAGRYTITIPLATLPPQTYVVRIRSGSFSFTRRLEVVR